MPNIIFTKPDGSEHIVTVENGVTVMEAGRDAGLGIEGHAAVVCLVRPVMSLLMLTGLPKPAHRVKMKLICLIWHLALRRHRALVVRLKCRMRLMDCAFQFQKICRADYGGASSKNQSKGQRLSWS